MIPIVIGHRGAAAHALENTAASFAAAVRLGAGMIEFDVRESLDGEFIVIHDAHLGRISSSRNVVCQSHGHVLTAIELKGGHRLLTLKQAFDAIPKTVGVMPEIKAIRSFHRLAAFLQSASSHREVLTTSFDVTLLRKLQDHGPSLRLGVVSKTAAKLSKAKKIGLHFGDVCLDFQCLTGRQAAELKRTFGRVFVWTVDRPADIQRMIDCGVDGVISNRPDEVVRILAKCKI